MSKKLHNEINKLDFVDVKKVSDNTYLISKTTKIQLRENECFLIKLNDTIYLEDSILTSNWNNGRIPQGRYYQIDVNKIMSNMIRVTGIGYEDATCTKFKDNWFGWLPIEEIEVISKI